MISDRPLPQPLFVPSNDRENSTRAQHLNFSNISSSGQSSSNNSLVFATENKISVVVSPNSRGFFVFFLSHEEIIHSDVFIFVHALVEVV